MFLSIPSDLGKDVCNRSYQLKNATCPLELPSPRGRLVFLQDPEDIAVFQGLEIGWSVRALELVICDSTNFILLF